MPGSVSKVTLETGQESRVRDSFQTGPDREQEALLGGGVGVDSLLRQAQRVFQQV